MKETINGLLFFKMKLWHFIYSYQFSLTLSKIYDRLYSAWIRSNIPNMHKSAIIRKGCYLVGGRYIKIGKNTMIERHSVLTCWDNYGGNKYTPKIEIGEECSLGEYLHITCIGSISIGNGVLLGRRITISDNSHGYTEIGDLKTKPTDRPLVSKGAIVIEDNVWIGDKATILSGVRIGKGTVVAANAVVTKDVPAYSVVGGIPAIILKQHIES